MSYSTKNAKFITIALISSLQRFIALRAVSLPTIPAFIQTMNVNEQLHFARCKHTVQDPPDTPLLITDFPTIHGRLLANVRAFRSVLPLLFPNGQTGPPSAFQAA